MGYATKRVKRRRHNFLRRCHASIVLGGADLRRVMVWVSGAAICGDYLGDCGSRQTVKRFCVTTPDGKVFGGCGTVPLIVRAAKAMGVI